MLQAKIADVSRKVEHLKRTGNSAYFRAAFGEGVSYRQKWQNLNSLLGRRKKEVIEVLRGSDGEMISDPKLMAEVFADHFSQQGLSVDVDVAEATRGIAPNNIVDSMFVEPVTIVEVEELLTQLKPKRSLGFDGISPFAVNKCARDLTLPLVQCMNKFFAEFRFPDTLKIAKVVPIPKKGSPFELDDFRGISVATPFAKLFEMAIANRITRFLEPRGFFFERQFAYRKKSSTTSCVVEVADKIFSALDHGMAVTGIFLDLSKAFDLVDHEVLLRKLECYGVRGRSNDLVRSYLCGRMQYVEINGERSGMRPVQKGVPQGSCMGPLMYLIYTNDVARLPLSGTLFNFADDGAILYESMDYETNCEQASVDVRVLKDYNQVNGLRLNLLKTVVMHFRRRRDTRPCNYRVVCENQEITRVSTWR